METRSTPETRSAPPSQVRVKPTQPVFLTGQERPASQRPSPETPVTAAHRRSGYGLPCSRCRVYYPADMPACPICKSTERVSATAMAEAVQVAPEIPRTEPKAEDDRDRLLKELKSQVFASHTQINTAATFRCCLDQNHNGNFEPAAVCHNCYAEMRQTADRMEAALHMDLKEASQIVYNAVWADPSDASKTYENAAAALLSELRKRAGISLLLGSLQPLAH